MGRARLLLMSLLVALSSCAPSGGSAVHSMRQDAPPALLKHQLPELWSGVPEVTQPLPAHLQAVVDEFILIFALSGWDLSIGIADDLPDIYWGCTYTEMRDPFVVKIRLHPSLLTSARVQPEEVLIHELLHVKAISSLGYGIGHGVDLEPLVLDLGIVITELYLAE